MSSYTLQYLKYIAENKNILPEGMKNNKVIFSISIPFIKKLEIYEAAEKENLPMGKYLLKLHEENVKNNHLDLATKNTLQKPSN